MTGFKTQKLYSPIIIENFRTKVMFVSGSLTVRTHPLSGALIVEYQIEEEDFEGNIQFKATGGNFLKKTERVLLKITSYQSLHVINHYQLKNPGYQSFKLIFAIQS